MLLISHGDRAIAVIISVKRLKKRKKYTRRARLLWLLLESTNENICCLRLWNSSTWSSFNLKTSLLEYTKRSSAFAKISGSTKQLNESKNCPFYQWLTLLRCSKLYFAWAYSKSVQCRQSFIKHIHPWTRISLLVLKVKIRSASESLN